MQTNVITPDSARSVEVTTSHPYISLKDYVRYAVAATVLSLATLGVAVGANEIYHANDNQNIAPISQALLSKGQ